MRDVPNATASEILQAVSYFKKKVRKERHGTHAMRWEDALVAANRPDVRSELAAYELSYRYLDGGREMLSEQEQFLRRAISLVAEGEELPVLRVRWSKAKLVAHWYPRQESNLRPFA